MLQIPIYKMKKVVLLCLFIFPSFGLSQKKKENLSAVANTFLNTLTPELKNASLFDFNSAERTQFFFVPVERKGTSFNQFNESQKEAALNLLKASLSKKGFYKSEEIRQLEKVLLKIENPPLIFNGKKVIRDYLDYHFWIFGVPSETKLWGWKFEGHHISFNFISKNNTILSSTPSFLGANPAIVAIEGFKKKQVLKSEMNMGTQLVSSFDTLQNNIAQFSKNAPIDIITKNNFKAEKINPLGISYNELNASQKDLFLELLDEYMDTYIFGFAEDLRKKVYRSGIENLHFAYAGEINSTKGFYYRIQGGDLLIEYDNIQNDANHVHSVVRDLSNDWGESILKKHYSAQHNVN